MALTDDELRAQIVGAGWRIESERPEEVTREANRFTVVDALFSASKETRNPSVAGSLLQLRDVCLSSDAALASLKPVEAPPEVVVVPVPTPEDLVAAHAELQETVVALQQTVSNLQVAAGTDVQA